MKNVYRNKSGTLFGVLYAFIILIPGVLFPLVAMIVMYFDGGPVWQAVLFTIFMYSLLIFLHYNGLGANGFSKLTLYKNHMKWSCPGYLSVILQYDEIKYVSIEDNQRVKFGSTSVIIRGDEDSYICLSTFPISSEYKGKILKCKSRKGFIKFRYSDDVCEALMNVLPLEKQGHLRGFYAQMQLEDRRLEKEREQEKRRIEREKELKKRQKEKQKKKARHKQ